MMLLFYRLKSDTSSIVESQPAKCMEEMRRWAAIASGFWAEGLGNCRGLSQTCWGGLPQQLRKISVYKTVLILLEGSASGCCRCNRIVDRKRRGIGPSPLPSRGVWWKTRRFVLMSPKSFQKPMTALHELLVRRTRVVLF